MDVLTGQTYDLYTHESKSNYWLIHSTAIKKLVVTIGWRSQNSLWYTYFIVIIYLRKIHLILFVPNLNEVNY